MIAIIGGGPAGCYAGFCLAKKGKEVTIIEEHKRIGIPVQCTGIVTSSLNDTVKTKKEFVMNKIKRARIFSKRGFVELRLKNPNLILDRQKFDSHLAEMAKNEGAKIMLDSKFIGNDQNRVYTNKGVIDAESIIGADGPLSMVAKANSMFGQRKFWHGIQARVKIRNDNAVEFYPNTGTIAWVVPENRETARIGLMAPMNANKAFQRFLKKKAGKSKVLEYQSGLVPVYNPKQQTQKGNAFLVGDAAGQVKATTGGGIIQGLKAAECLASCIAKGMDYEKEWHMAIGRDLWIHLKMRELMDRFRERDWSRLVGIFRKKKSRKILEDFDRDYPSRFILRLLLKEPSLLLFAGCLLRKPSKQKSF